MNTFSVSSVRVSETREEWRSQLARVGGRRKNVRQLNLLVDFFSNVPTFWNTCMVSATARSHSALVLPVPGSSEPQSDDSARSRAFHFPYPTAYRIQLDLMSALFDTIEQGKAGVFESPTGTGKTLSLLCSALTWLEMNRQRHILGVRASTETKETATGGEDDSEPDWVLAHEEARQRESLALYENELRERLDRARLCLPGTGAAQQDVRPSRGPKRARVDTGSSDITDDDEFLVDDYSERPKPNVSKRQVGSDMNLSDEVRAMMQAYEEQGFAGGQCGGMAPENTPETRPKIFYASRTHSQLAQLINEVKRTPFGKAREPVRSISLGSRKHMCLHADVRLVGATSGTDAMNERCLELIQNKKGQRCPFLPPHDAMGQVTMDRYRDHALAQVHDIEELVQLGKDLRICPYFGTRYSARNAELVTLPYNLLLQHDAREALQLSLEESILLIDEAHNLIDTILATYTTELTQAHIDEATAQVDVYLQRFSMRLKGVNEEHIRILQVILHAMQSFCAEICKNKQHMWQRDTSLTLPAFMAHLGGSVDQINVCILGSRSQPRQEWIADVIARTFRALAQRHTYCSKDWWICQQSVGTCSDKRESKYLETCDTPFMYDTCHALARGFSACPLQ